MSYVLVAEAEDRIVGSVAVADRSFAKPMFKACLADFFFSILRNPRLLFERSLWKRLFRQAEASPQGHKIVNHPGLAQMTIGAVDSSFRGQGIFGELVKATTVYSHARGSRAVRAGVYKPNSSSRRVFEKCGWIETPTLETADTVNYIFYIDSSFREELGLIDQE
jgi:RimJ/RimL family protein N-acetyltransferase